NPGALVAGWPGKLDFAIDTQGRMTSRGPSARLDMSRLRGSLRGRPVSGQAALTLDPNKVVAGHLDVRSGESSIRVTGQQGSAMNVTAELDVAKLDDWIPQSTGHASGKFRITGRWPQIAVEGTASGGSIAVAEAAVEAVSVDVDIRNPLQPEGSLE